MDSPNTMIRHRVPERMDVQFTVPMTRRTRTLLEAVANYQRTTVAHVIRDAIHTHLSQLGVEESKPKLDELVNTLKNQSDIEGGMQ